MSLGKVLGDLGGKNSEKKFGTINKNNLPKKRGRRSTKDYSKELAELSKLRSKNPRIEVEEIEDDAPVTRKKEDNKIYIVAEEVELTLEELNDHV